MLTLYGSWKAKNSPKLSWKYLIDRICKIKLYLNYINWRYIPKHSSNPEDILKSAKKKNYEKLYTKETTSKAATTEFLSKIPNRKKISNEYFNLCEAETSLDKIIKSINSQTNYKSPVNDGLKAVFYKYFSNELVPVLLDVYNSWGKLDTISVTSRIESYLSYIKKVMKEILRTIDPFHF